MITKDTATTTVADLWKSRIDLECDVVVVDIGSGSIKAGWAGEDAPRGSLRINVAAVPLSQPFQSNNLLSSLVAPAGVITHPVAHGSITDFAVFAKVMEDMYEDILECNSKEHSLLMTYSFAMSLAERTQLAQLMFERFQVPSLALVNTSSLSLFSTGRTTGLVIELGEGICSVAPIYEGFVLSHAVHVQKICEKDENGWTLSDVQAPAAATANSGGSTSGTNSVPRTPSLTATSNGRRASLISSASGARRTSHVLNVPANDKDRNSDKISSYAEASIKKPADDSEYIRKIAEMIISSLQMCDRILCNELLKNIILSGGRSMEKGLNDKIHSAVLQQMKEKHRFPSASGSGSLRDFGSDEIIISCDSQRRNAAWIGGSMFASLSTFPIIRVTSEQYKRDPHIIHKRTL